MIPSQSPLLLLRYRRVLIITVQAAFMVVANYVAFWLRFDGDIPPRYVELFVLTLPVLVTIRQLAFIPFRLYEGLWKYTGIYDLRNIIAGVGSGTLVFFGVVHWGLGFTHYPRSVYVIDSVLLIFFVGGIRLARRIAREMGLSPREKRILIFGAGDAGEMILRDMRNNAFYDYEPVGFVDDDRSKVGQRIHGVPVLGTRDALPRIMASIRPHEVLVAMPRAEAAVIRSVVKALEPYKVPITTLPSFRDVIDGKVTVSQIRHLALKDLLARPQVGLDPDPVRRLLRDRCVMVTGAGGSIGSELCRQIAAFGPSELVLYERYENGLYAIGNDLADLHPTVPVHLLVGDIADERRVNQVIGCHRPEVIFHAAAHKHLPLMEQNPCEAVKNNVRGTRILAAAAARWGVDRFVFISSDKAVNPTSVMGATKRVAELVLRGMNHGSATCFMTVRFGNVLGSTGSVVPRFMDQIKRGGPLTVTHPEVCRYFMLVTEAVQLVLHAATRREPGTIFVLEMGDQIRIADMARTVIRLSGFVPDEEIGIEFVGLRPGEKLAEELVGADEIGVLSGIEKILTVQPLGMPDRALPAPESIEALERAAAMGESGWVVEQLRALVPTFRPPMPESPPPGGVYHAGEP
jgi:FlaA1/EpsC-like NDP-sugar epimerase